MIPSISNAQATNLSLYNSSEWKPVLEWSLDRGQKVRLLRYENGFMTEYDAGNAIRNVGVSKVTRAPVQIPDGMSPEQLIEDLSTRNVAINSDGSVDYLITEKSRVSDKTIDERNWAITIADLGQSTQKKENTWGGHAVIVIESVDEDGYKMRKADIVGDRVNPTWANIRLIDTNLEKLITAEHIDDRHLPDPRIVKMENFPRSETWIRTRDLVQGLIENIKMEREKYLAGNPVVFFDPQIVDLKKDIYNCMLWCRINLQRANIVLPVNFVESILPTPVCYLNKKASIISTVVGAGGIWALKTFALSFFPSKGSSLTSFVCGWKAVPIVMGVALIGSVAQAFSREKDEKQTVTQVQQQ